MYNLHLDRLGRIEHKQAVINDKGLILDIHQVIMHSHGTNTLQFLRKGQKRRRLMCSIFFIVLSTTSITQNYSRLKLFVLVQMMKGAHSDSIHVVRLFRLTQILL